MDLDAISERIGNGRKRLEASSAAQSTEPADDPRRSRLQMTMPRRIRDLTGRDFVLEEIPRTRKALHWLEVPAYELRRADHQQVGSLEQLSFQPAEYSIDCTSSQKCALHIEHLVNQRRLGSEKPSRCCGHEQ